jgi:uncharacterized protein (TIRG00374 family)
MPNSSPLPRRISLRSWGVWGIRLLGLAASIAIGAYLLGQIDVQQFLAMIREVPILSLVAAFLIYMLMNFFRAMRFSVLLGGQGIPVPLLYPIVLYHNFLVRTLPFKTGELSYVMMVRHYLRKPVVEGVGSLVNARLFDLLMVTSCCTVGLLTVAVPNTEHLLFTLLLPCLVVCAVGLYFAAPLLRKGLELERRLLKNRRLGQSRAAAWVDQKILSLTEHLEQTRNPRSFALTIGLSACNYAGSASFNLLLLHALGISAPFGTLIVVVSIVMFAEALPFSIAGLGLVEGGWTFGLVTFAALPTSQAISVAFFQHGCQLTSAFLSGLLGYCLLHTPAFRSSTRSTSPSGQGID